MADIQPEIDDFQDAVYGEEVRGALISLANKLNTEMETATDKVNAHDESIAVAIEDAESATSAANAAADAANESAATCDTATGAANAAAAAATSAAGTANATNTSVTAAETARVTAEQGRVSAEAARVTAEQNRAAAEQLRAQSEISRTSFEDTRQENEQLRQSAEAARVTAEAERQGAESGRVSAEGLRVQAEAGRVTAENNRANAFAQMQQQILPPANNITLGGVIIGEGINYDSNGKISIPSGVYETEQHAAETYATKTEMSGKANATHVHTANDITSGTLAVARGGTGAATAADARTALSLYSKSEIDDVLNPLLAAMANAKALLGQLGLDGNDDPLIDAATARANLDAAQSNGATGTLKAAEGEIDALESSLAYVESTTARTNHAVGDYFMLGNVLMKATAAIAAGETINASKATPATVQGQIDTLRDSVGFASYVGEHTFGSHAAYTSITDLASIRFPKRGFVVIVLGMWIQVDNDYGSWNLWTKEMVTGKTILDVYGGVESSSVRIYSLNNIIAIEVTQNTDLHIMWKNTTKVSNQKLVWNCLSSAGAPIITYNV